MPSIPWQVHFVFYDLIGVPIFCARFADMVTNLLDLFAFSLVKSCIRRQALDYVRS